MAQAMSDNWIQFIPHDPTYQPSRSAAESARELLSSFVPDADEVVFKFTDTVEFIHPGGNWSGVKCPNCGADAEPWWKDAMDTAYKTRFANLKVTAACCGASVSLNELNYVWPAGFAKFVIEAMNPNVEDLTDAQVQQLSKCLACDLRRIWVHI
jgi:hypothetical protein